MEGLFVNKHVLREVFLAQQRSNNVPTTVFYYNNVPTTFQQRSNNVQQCSTMFQQRSLSPRAVSFRDKLLLSGDTADMSSCSTRRHVLLLHKKTCLLVPQEDMSSCSTRIHVLFNRKTCLLAQQEDMSSCSTRRHVFLFNKKTPTYLPTYLPTDPTIH